MAHHTGKHHDKKKGPHAPRDKGAPIGMVAERSNIATFLTFGLVGFVALAILVVLFYMIFN